MIDLYRLSAIVRKEALDARRDIKSLATALVMPILFAGMLLGIFFFMVSIQDGNRNFTLHVKGIHNATPLVDWLQESGITVKPFNEDPVTAIKNRESDLVLEIPESFASQFREQQSAELNLYSDHSETKIQVKSARIKQLIYRWNASVGSLRLIARNISPGVSQVSSITDVNVANPQRVTAKILSGLPLIILLIAFVSGIGMSADMAAGEKERRSLEPLLINPTNYETLFFGKWLAAVLVTFTITCFGVGLQFIAIRFAPLAELGFKITLSFSDYVMMIIILLPIMFMATALQLLVSLISKSFKDAQSYNSLVMMLPMVPGIYLIFNSSVTTLSKMFFPIMGPQLLLVDIISGEKIALLYVLCSSLTSMLTALILATLAIRELKKEKMLF